MPPVRNNYTPAQQRQAAARNRRNSTANDQQGTEDADPRDPDIAQSVDDGLSLAMMMKRRHLFSLYSDLMSPTDRRFVETHGPPRGSVCGTSEGVYHSDSERRRAHIDFVKDLKKARKEDASDGEHREQGPEEEEPEQSSGL